MIRKNKGLKVLLVGSGGREHAIAWRLAASEECAALYCAPGNPGIADIADCVPIAVDDIASLVNFADEKKIDLVVVGPEAPLVAGLSDRLAEAGIAVFGPSAAAARLEGSKGFTKDLCTRYNIPTAAYGRFTDMDKASAFIHKTGAPIVVKADGLAAGKGVVIAHSTDEAIEAACSMLTGGAFGTAGTEIVVEEFLDGEELSFFALCDGEAVLPFACAQDHKRVGDGDTGPNTGGMGAYSPAHLITPDLHQKIMDRIIRPTVSGMKADGAPFRGVLFAGIMVVGGDPFLIEYNVRFGDPECQVVMARLENDLLRLLYACARGDLAAHPPITLSANHALGVVMAAKGYPGAAEKGSILRNLDAADAVRGVKIFHAGTALGAGGEIAAHGGRVLTVVATAGDIKTAQHTAYLAVDLIDWPEGFCRRDIGWRAVAAKG
jgi:phosphoribosylamine--glycine ligase